MKAAILKMLLIGLIVPAAWSAPDAPVAPIVQVYKSPTCGCCKKWIEHLERGGFEVKAHDVADVAAMRRKLGMPERLGACHTATVGGYLVEGHVPAADIRKLLKDKPAALGIAVPGMPPGSPGMETPKPVPYDTLLVGRDGSTRVFSHH
ncbi:MAG: DUF411 domain-containing protein [Candidatus Thermoplasmatota archaeon]|nr:DUF411 domain-containing protein [Candidatus Thermoplasmatota archaeon]